MAERMLGGLGGSTGAAFRRLEQCLDESTMAPEAKATLAQEIEGVKEELLAYQKDKWFYRIVVSVLGLAILFVIVSISVLLAQDKTGFDALTSIGSAAVGGLVGLLAPSPVGGK